MTAERWQLVREILYGASEIHADRRARFLAERCGDDAPLRAEIESLLGALDESGGFLETAPLPTPDLEGTRIGPYRILEEAGRGGMGVVYRALRDDDYRQTVAIKLVRVELSNSLLLDRFRAERQTLALLSHPNIARLLDGGATSDGRPYLVMEWVDGKPILEDCRDRALTTRQRLLLFLQVCRAVAHAHRNLVVHRDLKPSNILITAEGEPKLVDFGIAKVFSQELPQLDVTLTNAGARALTPDYASPEQVRGEPVTTATDIYSLGAVLYEMLTGARPHRIAARTAAAIEHAICVELPLPASNTTGTAGVARRDLQGDLDNILARALEKEPSRRYPHVDEFAADVQRHLDGQPVLARPVSFWYRASRSARRNKLPVAAAAAVALALAGGMAVALWQARVARGERRIAEQRFELARQLAGSVLYEFHDGISDLQGSLKVRQLLLARSMQYLDALAAGAHSSPALQRDLANGYERVATLQGSGGTANLGRPEAAIQSLQKAVQLRQQVLASNPASVEFRRELARTHRIFSEINASGSERLEHAQAALSLVEALFRQNPNDPGIRNDLANAEYAMATPLQQQSRFPEAMEYLRKALGHTPDTYPGNAALYHKRLGAILIRTGDLHSALAEYQAAVAIDEPRAAASPSDARARLDLTYGYSDMGLILRGLGRFPEALQQYRKAEKIRAEAAAADPRDARAASGLASATMRIADLLAVMGDRRQAEPAYLQAVRVAESFRTRFPEKREAATQLAETCRLLGFSYQSRWSSCAQARPWLDRALAIYRETNDAEGIQVTQGIMTACHF